MKMLSRIASIVPLFFVLSSCATSHVIMVGQVRPATSPDLVRVYMTPPRHFERIAIINSSSGGSWAFTERAQVDEAIAKIKEEAAKLGANAVWLQAVGTRSSGSLGIGMAVSVSEVEDITLMQSAVAGRFTGRSFTKLCKQPRSTFARPMPAFLKSNV